MVNMIAYHDSQNIKYRNPFGALRCSSQVSLCIDIITSLENIKVELFFQMGNDIAITNMNLISDKDNKKVFQIDKKIPQHEGLIWYYFIIENEGQKLLYGNNHEGYGGEGILVKTKPTPYQITIYKPKQIPDWYKQSTMYQIFVDRFYNSKVYDSFNNLKINSLYHSKWDDVPFYVKNEKGEVVKWDFFGGNIKGIIEKLPYLNSLGIGVIYLNPIFEAESNHKYDTGDYQKIDRAFGTEKILKELIEEARKYEINIMLDGVFSHTGSNSVYFNVKGEYDSIGAFQSKESDYYSWYRFKNHPKEYDCWWGVETLPNVDEMNPSYLDFIVKGEDSIIKKWMKIGVKGWRLDVADELPDEFIKEIKVAMNEIDKDGVLLGEVWEDASNKVSYSVQRQYLLGEEFDSIMNYPFREIFVGYMLGNISAEVVKAKIMSLYENYPKEHFYSLMNLIGGHDRMRILTLLGESPYEGDLTDWQKANYKLNETQKELAIKRLKLLSLIQFTWPGVPCIYYGDEVGCQGYADPYNRGTYPWENENTQMLDWYKKITSIRNNNDVFKKGEWSVLISSGDVFGFTRTTIDKKALCIFNRSKYKPESVDIGMNTIGFDLIEEEDISIIGKIILQPLEGKVIILK